MLFKTSKVRESRRFRRKRFHRVRRYREMLFSASAMMGVQAVLFLFLAVLSYQTWVLVRGRFLAVGVARYLLPVGILALGVFFLVRARASYVEIREIRAEIRAMGEDTHERDT